MTAFQAARSSPRPASRLVSGYRPASAIAGSAPTTMQSTGLLKLARLVTLPPLTSNGTVASILPANRPEVSVRAGSGTGLAGLKSARTAKPPEALATSLSTVALMRPPRTVMSTSVNTTRLYMIRIAPVRKRRATGYAIARRDARHRGRREHHSEDRRGDHPTPPQATLALGRQVADGGDDVDPADAHAGDR